MFDERCKEHGFKQRSAKLDQASTNGQALRTNRTIKSAADNRGRRLETLIGFTPYGSVCRQRTTEPVQPRPGTSTLREFCAGGGK